MLARLLFTVLVLTSLTLPSANADSYEIVNVPKVSGIPWFNRMKDGVEQAGNELDVNAYQVGPASADPAQQVKIIEDLIAKGVDAITVVPNDAKVLEPVFEKARQAGILVLTQEAPDQKGAAWDVETIDSTLYAQRVMDELATQIGGKGGYVIYVGSLTVPLHNFWADAAIAYQKKKYPEMYQVTSRMPVAESIDASYSATLDLMKAHPDMKGIIGFGSLGPIGAGQALKKKRAGKKIAVVGIMMPAQSYPYLRKGDIRMGFLWDPKDAGYALTVIADKILKGETIDESLTIGDLGKASIDSENHVIRFNKILEVTKDNARSLGF